MSEYRFSNNQQKKKGIASNCKEGKRILFLFITNYWKRLTRMEDHNVNHTWMGHLNHQVNIFPCEASIKRRRVLLHPLGQPFTSSHVMRRKEVHNLWEIGRWKVQNLTTEGALEAKAEAAGIGWREKFLIENPYPMCSSYFFSSIFAHPCQLNTLCCPRVNNVLC